MMQQGANYMSYFKPPPTGKKPTDKGVKRIVRELLAGNKVVEIPGYSSLYEFTKANEEAITEQLSNSQILDGFAKFAWVRNMRRMRKSKKEWEKFFSKLKTKVQDEKELTYLLFRMDVKSDVDGKADSHAGLVKSVSMGEDGVWSYTYVDSNQPTSDITVTYDSNTGEVTSDNANAAKYIPHLDRHIRVDKMVRARKKFCEEN